MEKQENLNKKNGKKNFLIVFHLFYCEISGNIKKKQMSIKEGVWIVKTLVKCKK